MHVTDRLLPRIKNSYLKTKGNPRYNGYHPSPSSEQSEVHARMIKSALKSDAPLMIGRLGTTELDYLIEYKARRKGLQPWSYIQGISKAYRWDNEGLHNGLRHSGIFPKDPKVMERFCERMLADIQMLDILGSWQEREHYLKDELKSIPKVHLTDLEPYYRLHDPWSSILAGKKVLVIHPFEASIQQQWFKRSTLYPESEVLPEFELQTLRAVQSIYGISTGFDTWFDALSWMEEEVAKRTFDIAIIGCGAYGFPLAAHVKRLGKKALHLGGATQIMFGIRGKRWDEHPVISKLINEHWIRPNEEETPKDAAKIVYGSYW